MQSATVPLNVPLGDGRGAGMVVVSMPEHPPDYTVWSIASMVYGNPFCLGLIALSFSMKVSPEYEYRNILKVDYQDIKRNHWFSY